MKKLEAAGNKNLVLDVTGKTAKETLANAVWCAALPSRMRPQLRLSLHRQRRPYRQRR